MSRPQNVTVHGLVAGFLAATALAVWFLVIDAVNGQPFYTPNFVAGVLLGAGTETEAGFTALTAGYTVFHYVVFMAIGAAVASLLTRIRTAPGLLLGAVLGFLLFDLLFYFGVVVTGVDVVDVLGWPSLLFGNILAGVVLMFYLYARGVAEPVSWGELLREHRILREGIYAGLIGAFAVAAWFLILDLAKDRLLFTPSALGSLLFYGARDAAAIQIDLATVLGYTAIHFGAFVLVGLVAAALVTEAEHEPPLVLALALLFVVLETFFIGMLAIIAGWLLDTLEWWAVAVGNLVAAFAMGAYLWRAHPVLRRELRRHAGEIEEPAYHG